QHGGGARPAGVGAREGHRDQRARVFAEREPLFARGAAALRLLPQRGLVRGYEGNLRAGEERLGDHAHRHDQDRRLERNHDKISDSGRTAGMTLLVFSSRLGPLSGTMTSSVLTPWTRRLSVSTH